MRPLKSHLAILEILNLPLESEEIPPHADVQKQSNPHERRDHERPAVTEKGKRNSNDGHHSHHHADVDEDMPEEHGDHAERQDGSKSVLGCNSDAKSPQDEDRDRDRSPGATRPDPIPLPERRR